MRGKEERSPVNPKSALVGISPAAETLPPPWEYCISTQLCHLFVTSVGDSGDGSEDWVLATPLGSLD